MLVVGFIAAGVISANHVLLQRPMNDVLQHDPRNTGIAVSVHYGTYVNPALLIYDLKGVSGNNTMTDVFRVFLQFADRMQARRFEMVELCYRGRPKFTIHGEYFQKLGAEYRTQNPVYTVRTFPENLLRPNGSRAYPEWTGGLFGVLAKQMEDVAAFHRSWYLDEFK
jgi:hypothetical protein